jgi:zinc protease
VFVGNPDAYKEHLEVIEQATPAALQAAAKQWLDDRQYVLQVNPFPSLTTTASDVDRKKGPPSVSAPPEAPLPTAKRATLSNGTKLVLVTRSSIPLVRLALIVDSGFAADDPKRPGVSSMTMRMLDEGTSTRSALAIADTLASLGAELDTGSRLDTCSVSLSALSDKLDPALDLFADVVLNPSFPESDLAREKKNVLAQIQQEKVEPFGLALRVLPRLLYGEGHAYAQPLTGSGTEASVQAMTREDLVAFHRTWFKPNHATIVAVGDIPMDRLKAKLERTLAAWKPGDVPEKRIPPVQPPPGSTVYLLDRPGAEQSVILVGTVVAPKANPDEFAFQAFNEVFGGAFTSRVNMNLREAKHWSYGAGSVALDARGQRPWIIFAPVQTDKTSESLQALSEELDDITGKRPVSDDELAKATDRRTRTLAGRWETGSAVLDALDEITTYGLPDDYYQTYAQKTAAVTRDDVGAAVSKAVDRGHLVWVVVGDRAKIEKGVRDLKLGPVRLLNGDAGSVTTE